MISTAGLKYVMAVASLVVAIVGLWSAEWFAKRPKLAAGANCFIGGIILATALAHLLADATEDGFSSFPWQTTLMGVGYGVLFSIEQWAHQSADEQRVGSDELYTPLTNDEEQVKPTMAESHDGHDHKKKGGHSHAEGNAFAATLALVIHSIGDGASMALQDSSTRIGTISGAICFHKLFAACALGTILNRAFTPNSEENKEMFGKAVVYGLLFAFTTPVAIVAIVAAQGSFPEDSPAVTYVTALCAGSLLYVGIHEIMPLGFDDPKIPLWSKIALFWLGYGIMALLAIWA